MRWTFRQPDQRIGGVDDPYMLRWWLLRSRFLTVYLHRFRRSDDERALHDHPSWSISLVLKGGYYEVIPHPGEIDFERGVCQPGSRVRIVWRRAGSIVFRRAEAPHRIALGFDATGRATRANGPVWSIWIRGPRKRVWGFYTEQGWVDWRRYTPA